MSEGAEMARDEGTDFSRKVAETIVEQLRAGTAPWIKPWKPGERFLPYNAATGNDYHGIDAVWLMAMAQMKGYSDSRWMTFNQAHEEGVHVRRGERGTRIEFWKWDDVRTVLDGNGQPVLGHKGEPKKERVELQRPKVFSAVVFNAEQIEGLAPAKEPELAPDWQRHDRAEALLRASEARIQHEAGNRAFYSPKNDAITLPERDQFETADRYYATALHELGHWTGHQSRLNRDLVHPFGSEGCAREELRAEIASLLIGQELGIGHDPGQHAAYIDHWIQVLEKEPREILRAAADAEKIVTFVRGFERKHEQSAQVEQGVTQTEEPAEVDVKAPVLARESEATQVTADHGYLAVPYAEKGEAKALGARWDKEAKCWYAPEGAELERLQRWMPQIQPVRVDLAEQHHDPRVEFAAAMREAGLRIEGLPEMDGRLHRAAVEGDKGREVSGVYKGHLDGHPAGFIQNHKTGFKTNWKSNVLNKALGARERATLVAESAQRRQEREKARELQYEQVAEALALQWSNARPVEE
jgi:putative DNA primase/helicase